MGLIARVVFEDGDRSASDRHYVTLFLDDTKILESRSMSEKDCEKLCAQINDVVRKEQEARC